MENKQPDQELENLKASLRTEANKFTEAISKKDRAQINILQAKINQLLAEIKSKSSINHNSIAA